MNWGAALTTSVNKQIRMETKSKCLQPEEDETTPKLADDLSLAITLCARLETRPKFKPGHHLKSMKAPPLDPPPNNETLVHLFVVHSKVYERDLSTEHSEDSTSDGDTREMVHG